MFICHKFYHIGIVVSALYLVYVCICLLLFLCYIKHLLSKLLVFLLMVKIILCYYIMYEHV